MAIPWLWLGKKDGHSSLTPEDLILRDTGKQEELKLKTVLGIGFRDNEDNQFLTRD